MTLFNEDLGYEEAREVKDILGELLDSPGWKLLEEFIEERTKIREKELISSCPETVEQMVRFAKIKGGHEELLLLPLAIHQMYSNVSTFLENYSDDDDEGESQLNMEM